MPIPWFPSHHPVIGIALLSAACALVAPSTALAQRDADDLDPVPVPEQPAPSAETPVYRLDDRSDWSEASQNDEPAPGTQAAEIRAIRHLLADDRPNDALVRLDALIERAESEGSRYLDEALLMRGDAKIARDEEFEALYDYERLIRTFPQSEHFVTAVDRETRVADLYLDGLKLRVFGIRLVDGEDIAIELLIRAQERLPDSSIAERSALRIADYYYQKREMRLARDAYELYLANFPSGPNRVHAERRLIYADMARFKGPRYDGAALQDVRLRIRDFVRRYPSEATSSGINEGLIARIDESTAAQLLESARWYLRQNDEAAARYTLRRMLRVHPETISAQRARELMEEKGWLLPEDEAGESGEGDVHIEGPLADDIETIEDEPAEDEQP